MKTSFQHIIPALFTKRKTMRYFNLLLFLILGMNVLSAQTEEKVLLKVCYMAKFKNCEEDKERYQEEKILEIGYNQSRFYDRWDLEKERALDSIRARGGGVSDILNTLRGYPVPRHAYRIYKNYPRKDMLTCTDFIYKCFVYTEPMEKPQWKLLARDTTILGYKCRYAECHFRKRTWYAYYTSEIPINDGPWKLYGLPGLILHARDASGIFSFSCIDIKKGNGELMKKPNLKRFIRCTRAEMMELERARCLDPVAYARRYGDPGIGYGPDGKLLTYKPETALFLDY